MRLTRITSLAAAALALLASACSDAPTRISAPDEPARNASCSFPGSPARVDIIPSSVTIFVGESRSFYANVYDAAGCPVNGAFVGWGGSNSRISVTQAGSGAIVQGLSAGSAVVSASAGGARGFASVEVREPSRLTTITLTPNPARTTWNGKAYFTAKGKDQYGKDFPLSSITWSTDNAQIATIDASGVAMGTGVGTTTVRATSAGVTGTASLEITYLASMLPMKSYAYEEEVLVEAFAGPTGSYYYQWYTQYCSAGDCVQGQWYPLAGGQDLTEVTTFISRHDIVRHFKVTISHTSGGPVLAEAYGSIQGAGEPRGSGETCIIC